MQRRKTLGMTQEKCSEEIGISKNHLSSIERGVYTPTTQILFRICEVLGETPNYYLIGEISTETNKTVKLIQQLPSDSQKIILRLIEVYLEEVRN